MSEDTYVGLCYVCGVAIHKRLTGKDEVFDMANTYVVVSSGQTPNEETGLMNPFVVRCGDCYPGSPSWMESHRADKSRFTEYFKAGQQSAQERRVTNTAQRQKRVDVASPLLKSFSGRIKYFVHMAKVSGFPLPWELELVDSGFYYEAKFDGTELTIEANGMVIPFQPKESLTERLKMATDIIQ